MTAYTQPTQWTHALGNNADVSTLPDDTAGTTGLASLQKLFQLINQTPLAAGGVAPSREDFNALFKLLGESIFYMQNGGVWTYNASYDYKVGRVVLHTDGNLYKCIKDNGVSSTVKAPTDTTYWTKLSTQIDVAAVDAKTATNKQNIAAIKSNYVTTNSQQNITALKVLETSSGTSIFFKDPRFERAKAPSADIFNSVTFIDKNNANLGYMQVYQKKDSNNALYIAANRDKNGQSDGIALGLILPRDTTKAGYATAPSTPSSATANEIATAKFVNDKISAVTTGYVTTNTEQTITGKKTFTTTNKSVVTNIKVTNTDNTVTPTENLWVNAVSVVDKNTKNAGSLQFSRQTDGMNWVKLQAANQNTNGNDIFHVIGIGLKSDGTASTVAPKPASNSNDNNIATTSWVNDKVNPIKNNYVTTNTAQNITAIKTIVLPSNQHAIIVKDKSIANTDTPSSPVWQSMAIAVDKNSKERGCVQSVLRPDGSSCIKLMAIQQNAKGVNLYNSLELGIKADGTRIGKMEVSPASNSNDTSIATTAWVNTKISANQANVPTGAIIPFAGSSIPAGYLLCNGATVSRTTYANLFKVIGTTWGAGDGSTTFKLPDARGRFPEGANGNFGAYHAAGLPNITGAFVMVSGSHHQGAGAFSIGTNSNDANIMAEVSGTVPWFQFNASQSNAIYGKSTTVQPQSFCVQYLIKY